MTSPRYRLLGAALVAATLAGCAESSGPRGGGQLGFNIGTTGSSSPAPAGLMAVSDTMIDVGGNVLVLSKVEIVLREIELRRVNHDDCDSITAGDDDACEEFESGPILLDLPLEGGVVHQFAVSADSGFYNQVEFDIHKPEDDGDAADQAFLALHPEFEKVSIRVTGTYNGVDFVYTSDLSVEQEISINPPLEVTALGSAEVTLLVDVRGWFLNGSALVDPALALKGGAFEGVVKNSIEASFQAFHDDDRDGHSDDD